eukprot:scaffold127958_cov57-Phaeocystis_antarctica.AAC.6
MGRGVGAEAGKIAKHISYTRLKIRRAAGALAQVWCVPEGELAGILRARSGGHPGAARRVDGLEKPNLRYICGLKKWHVADPPRAPYRYPTVQADALGQLTSIGHARPAQVATPEPRGASTASKSPTSDTSVV